MPFYVPGKPDDNLIDNFEKEESPAESKRDILEEILAEEIPPAANSEESEKDEALNEEPKAKKPKAKNAGENKSKKNKSSEAPSSKASDAKDLLVTLIAAVAVGLFLNFFILVNAAIPSGSMEDTIMTGDRVFGLRLTYMFKNPERYDIAIFRYPDNEKILYIKRVIGLPNETVVVSKGEVYIIDPSIDTTGVDDRELLDNPHLLGDAKLLDRSFCKEMPMGGGKFDGVFRVPAGHYFMLGDNRNHSKDSRFWDNTFVAKEKILGKAFLKYWPITEIKTLGYKGADS